MDRSRMDGWMGLAIFEGSRSSNGLFFIIRYMYVPVEG